MKSAYDIADLRDWSDDAIRLGVIGDPVAHSLSPQMMNAALVHVGLPHRDARFHIGSEQLRDALMLMRDREFLGANITVPHKIAALGLMDFIDETADAIGAINTVQFRQGKLRGFNTDAVGFAKAIREEFDADVRQLRVLILGAGGASRAIAFACKEPRIWSRREDADVRELARAADLIVNATPLGLREEDAPPLTRDDFHAGQLVYDAIYRRTKLLDEAEAAGAQAASGLSMLLHQGAAAFEIWFNQPAPLDVMRAALRELA